jgi:hypothetical protein
MPTAQETLCSEAIAYVRERRNQVQHFRYNCFICCNIRLVVYEVCSYFIITSEALISMNIIATGLNILYEVNFDISVSMLAVQLDSETRLRHCLYSGKRCYTNSLYSDLGRQTVLYVWNSFPGNIKKTQKEKIV